MTASEVAIAVCCVVWVASFIAPLLIPDMRADPTIGLILMALVGGLVTLRRRKEETRR